MAKSRLLLDWSLLDGSAPNKVSEAELKGKVEVTLVTYAPWHVYVDASFPEVKSGAARRAGKERLYSAPCALVAGAVDRLHSRCSSGCGAVADVNARWGLRAGLYARDRCCAVHGRRCAVRGARCCYNTVVIVAVIQRTARCCYNTAVIIQLL